MASARKKRVTIEMTSSAEAQAGSSQGEGQEYLGQVNVNDNGKGLKSLNNFALFYYFIKIINRNEHFI